MKFTWFISLSFTLTILFSCGKKGGQDTPPNIAPSNLNIAYTISTDSTGNVAFVSTAENAVSYEYNFGNGLYQTVTSGSVTHKYITSGTYTVNVVARGAGGLTVIKSVTITVSVVQKLTWAEEFNYTGAPDPVNWGYDRGGNGWGNNELQHYTSSTNNASVSNGTLKITAIKESYQGNDYTSARILTKDKFSFKYGKFEARIKLPTGAGAWPAFWMLGSNISTTPWPACGEIDILEQKGREPNKIYAALHHPGRSGGNADGSSTVIQNATTEFHIYAADWTPSTIKFSIDGNVFYTFNNSAGVPFNHNFFIILNVAMGGNFGGSVDPAFTSAVMEVDYVRVYQ